MKPLAIADVDARSEELVKEFAGHWRVLQREGFKGDQNAAFMGWSLQKISSLQLLVEAVIEARGDA